MNYELNLGEKKVADQPKLLKTSNYSMFDFSRSNREMSVDNPRPQHRRLKASLERHGFLPSFPISVRKVGGRLVVEDGQHRLHYAQELKIEVYYVIIEACIDVAEINQAQANWQTKDYAKRWAKDKQDYQDAVEFSNYYDVPITHSLAVLAGISGYSNIAKKVISGDFEVKDVTGAHRIGRLYKRLCEITGVAKHQHLFMALYACCQVGHFDDERMVDTMQRRAGSFVNGGRYVEYLQQLEDVYNFGRKKVPLKFDAMAAMRARNPAKRNKKQ